ncbi:hypothetical protein GCM10017783_00810 [Deinococcus piscis]|uniref:Uncharacterized protein n=1 Tax=Deinococcus piscis TaxID=394230 RepID=A0ABQ3JWE6_9DEIO|nr:hypothetical protein [Deinococcus piscis]GHF92812.1 hypothetical protein GCM10017783_00810 [Deinococcus piscis]
MTLPDVLFYAALLAALPLWLVVGFRIPAAPVRLSRPAAYALSFACLTVPLSLLFLSVVMSVPCVGVAWRTLPWLALALFAGLAARMVAQAGGQREARLLYVLLGLMLLLAGVYIFDPLTSSHPLCAGQDQLGRMGAQTAFLTDAAKGVLPPLALLAYAAWQERRTGARDLS